MNISHYKTIGDILLVLIASVLLTVSASLAGTVRKMSKEELKNMLGNENLVVLDVRRGNDWTSSEFKIQGANRVAPGDIEKWADRFEKYQMLVLYCA